MQKSLQIQLNYVANIVSLKLSANLTRWENVSDGLNRAGKCFRNGPKKKNIYIYIINKSGSLGLYTISEWDCKELSICAGLRALIYSYYKKKHKKKKKRKQEEEIKWEYKS